MSSFIWQVIKTENVTLWGLWSQETYESMLLYRKTSVESWARYRLLFYLSFFTYKKVMKILMVLLNNCGNSCETYKEMTTGPGCSKSYCVHKATATILGSKDIVDNITPAAEKDPQWTLYWTHRNKLIKRSFSLEFFNKELLRQNCVVCVCGENSF